jgi:hypothetical protein
MGSPSLGNHLLSGFALGRNFQIGIGFGKIASRERLGRSPKMASKEVVMRTWPLSLRQEREKERVPIRRVIVRGQPYSWGRRRT